MKVFLVLVAMLISTLPITGQGQIIRGISDARKAKQLLDFYKDAVRTPQQVLQAAQDIKALYSSTQNYNGLNNKVAQDAGIFLPGPLALDFVEVAPESTGARSAGFSITLKQLKKDQCDRLSNHFINESFDSVIVNGVSYKNGPKCDGQLPFSRGRNAIKYITH